MSSYLAWATSLVSGGGPDICASITGGEAASGTALRGGWVLLGGVKKDDGKTEVSVLRFVGSAGSAELNAARNAVRRMKTLRHPDCLKYIDSCEMEEKKGASEVTLFVVTERVTTLEATLRELQDDENRNQYIAMGLQQIARAVSFLNNDAKIVHGNVCMDSIAVADSLDWKLHAFDVLSEFDASESEVPMLPSEFLIPPQYKPIEVAKGDWITVRRSPPWCIDAWGLGILIYEIFSFAKLSKSEDLRNTGAIPELLLSDYQKLLAGAPKRRMNPSKLLENEYFSGKLQDAILFLENLSIKDSAEKDAFFRKLGRIVDQMPTNVSRRKVLPLLLNALEYGGSPSSALGPLLQIAKQLSDDEFGARVLPCITRLFASTDRALRIALLQSITVLEPHFTAQLVNDQLFVNISAGFADSTAYLRELTLKSIIPLIPKLNSRNLNNELLKALAKLQVDPEGVIRANTTICLGKIAPSLSDAARKRVLLNAFTRAMKDQFPPARCAGLLAITATLKYYSPPELATRAIPAVANSLVDPDTEVRSNGFRCIEGITARLKEHSDELTKAGEAAKAANAASKGISGGGGGGERNPASSSLAAGDGSGAGLMGWAVGSLSTRLGGGDPAKAGEEKATISSTAAPAGAAAPREPARTHAAPTSSMSLKKSESSSRFSADGSNSGWSDGENPFEDDAGGNGDGWGGDDGGDDDDGWGDLDEPIVQPSVPKVESKQLRQQRAPPAEVSEAAAARSAHVQIPRASASSPMRQSPAKTTAARKPMKLGAKPKLGATKLNSD